MGPCRSEVDLDLTGKAYHVGPLVGWYWLGFSTVNFTVFPLVSILGK